MTGRVRVCAPARARATLCVCLAVCVRLAVWLHVHRVHGCALLSPSLTPLRVAVAGWDTWLTGAVDDRIIAIAPIVMDMLNFTQNVKHMYRSYGGWTFAFVVSVCVCVSLSLCV